MASKTSPLHTYYVETSTGFWTKTVNHSQSAQRPTHASVRIGDGAVRAWHNTEQAALNAVRSYQAKDGAHEVRAVEVRQGGKDAVLRELQPVPGLPAEDVAEAVREGNNRAAEILSGALGIEIVEVPAKARRTRRVVPVEAPAEEVSPEVAEALAEVAELVADVAPAAPKVRQGAKPTAAVNAVRQAHLDEIGLAMYRSRYDRGWEALKTGEGVARVVEGRAQLPWLDGFEDAAQGLPKWSAMLSEADPTVQVPRPGLAKAGLSPAPKAAPAAPVAEEAAPVEEAPEAAPVAEEAPKARRSRARKTV